MYRKPSCTAQTISIPKEQHLLNTGTFGLQEFIPGPNLAFLCLLN